MVLQRFAVLILENIMVITIELEGMLFTFHIHDVTISADVIKDEDEAEAEEIEEFDLDEFEIVEDENGDSWIYDEEAEVWYFYDAEEDSWLLDESEEPFWADICFDEESEQ
jgi:hypothetical protein